MYVLLSLRDYEVLSEFTLALFEDSGWYKANYTALYNLKQNPLQWGKGRNRHNTDLTFMYVQLYLYVTGLGCAFLMERCTNKSTFPYLCDARETPLVCTYDQLTKVRT